MREFFAALVPWATIVFAVSSMLAVGLANTVPQILAPFRVFRRVWRSLAINFVLAPALAYLLVRLFRLERPHAIGLFVAGSAADAPFLLKLTQVARGDILFAASLLILLLPTTILYLPVVVPLVAPGAQVSASAIAAPLLLTMLLPLALGLILRAIVPSLALSVAPVLSQFATYALVVLFASILIANTPLIVGLGWRPFVAALIFILGAFSTGWLLGARTTGNRDVVGLATAQRNIAAATVVATQTFAQLPGVLIMVTATAAAGFLVLFPIAFGMRSGLPARALRRKHA